jgi:hypothetical protein
MAFLLVFFTVFFTVVLSLWVVGLIVIALAAILRGLRGDRTLKKLERERPRPGDY